MKLASILLFFLIFFSTQVLAESVSESVDDSQKRFELRGGSVIVGTIVSEEQDVITIRTLDGKMIINRDSVVSIQAINEFNTSFVDPKSTRLLFSPTGRPLKKGHGYFTDFYVFLPGISYGFTDRFSVMAGMSVLPGMGLSDQIKYVAPRYSFAESKNSATAVGFLSVFASEGDSAGIVFATHTIGNINKSFTGAVGWGYTKEDSKTVDFYKYPIVMLGGNIRLNKHAAFVTENWLLTGQNIRNYPFVAGIRFFSKHIAVDIGAMLIGELLENGIPIPWLSFTYHFD